MTARQIQIEVCALHGVSREDLINPSNQRPIVAARNEAMARCRAELRMTFTQIGKLFRKHHSTVIHGIRQHLATPGVDPPKAHTLEQALARQARLLAAQGSVIADQARMIESMSDELAALREREARAVGQGQLFEVGKGAA